MLATYSGATVHSGTTLEPVRSWAWHDSVQYIYAIQAHRGLLYVLSDVGGGHKNTQEVHVYE